MALINCPNCNGTVSTKASACPHCGAAPVVELTEAERFQKLVDELGSISAARSAMEDEGDTIELDVQDRLHSRPAVAQAGDSHSPLQECKVTQTTSNHDSILARPLPKWIGVPMTAILWILCLGMILAYFCSEWIFPVVPLNIPNVGASGVQPEMLTREPQRVGNLHSQEMVDALFEMQNPGLRERIGTVAFEVQRQQFRKSQGFDELPKPSSSK